MNDQQIHVIEGSLVDDCLSDLEQYNAIDCLMVERPPNREVYRGGEFYPNLLKWIGAVDNKFDTKGSKGDARGRVKSLQYCWHKPSMRKVLIDWAPRTVEYVKKFNLVHRPYNLALTSTYMRLLPVWQWKKKTYISQLEQIKDLWSYEDDIFPDSYETEYSFICVGLLERNHKKDQLEAIKEVFSGWNITFVLYDDDEYHKDISVKGPKIPGNSRYPDVETFIKNGWEENIQFAGMKHSKVRKIKESGKRGPKKPDIDFDKVKKEFRDNNPLRYLQQIVQSYHTLHSVKDKDGYEKNSPLGKLDDNIQTTGQKVQDQIDVCIEKGVDIRDIEGINWHNYRDRFKVGKE